MMTKEQLMEKFINRLLNPSDLGFAVTKEVRDCARESLNIKKCELGKTTKIAVTDIGFNGQIKFEIEVEGAEYDKWDSIKPVFTAPKDGIYEISGKKT